PAIARSTLSSPPATAVPATGSPTASTLHRLLTGAVELDLRRCGVREAARTREGPRGRRPDRLREHRQRLRRRAIPGELLRALVGGRAEVLAQLVVANQPRGLLGEPRRIVGEEPRPPVDDRLRQPADPECHA